MTNQITPTDWEYLSAYLDSQLSARERADLEHRLQRSPELRQALAELDRVRTTIRSQPRLRAPRNFTLTPQMAGIRPGAKRGSILPSAFPVLRLASVLATLFFIVVSMGSLYVSRYGPAPAQVAVLPGDMTMQNQWDGRGGGGAAPMQQAAPPAVEASVTQTEAGAITSLGSEAPEASPEVLEVTPLAMDLTAVPTPAPSVAQAPMFNGKVPGQPQPAQPVAPGAEQSGQTQARSWRIAWVILVVVQVLLAILAMVTGAAALYLRRQARR